MSYESFSHNESVEKATLIALLKERGIDDGETKEMLVRWTEEQEKKVEALGTREAQVEFEIERAELYLDSGFREEGVQTLEDALMIAAQEGLDELAEKIENKLSAL